MLAMCDSRVSKTQAICLTPTRELAIQIKSDAIDKLCTKITPALTSETLLAGTTIQRNSRTKSHIVVSTPGKCCEAIDKK